MTGNNPAQRIHPRADPQLILSRLRARAEELSRWLEAALSPVGLTPADLEQASQRGTAIGPATLARGGQRWTADPAVDQVSWRQLLRPSLTQLRGSCRGRLLRV